MKLVVCDGSVLIDLERGILLQATFQLPFTFAVPDLLYSRELRPHNGSALIAMGLQVMMLPGSGLSLAQGYRVRQPRLSLPDALALALAKEGGDVLLTGVAATHTTGSHTLLSGDAALRELARIEKVECRGIFWVFDEIESQGILTASELEIALSSITAHPRCRLPKAEILARQVRYRHGRGR